MSNLLHSIITLVFCLVGFYFSWRFFKQEHFSKAVFLLMFCGFVLRIYTASDFYLHEWDERYHALVAKNLIDNPLKPTLYANPILPYDFKNWPENHVWLHKQPLALYSMATSMWIFGVNELALRLPSILLTTIGIWLAFFVGSYFFNKQVGYLTAFFFSINGLIIELAAGRSPTDHIDVFFLFFIELAVVFCILFVQRNKPIFNVLAGLSIGAAILSKWLPALIVLPIWLLLVLDSEKFKLREILFHFLVLIAVSGLVFLPWQIYIFNKFPLEASWEMGYNFKHLVEGVEQQTGSLYFFIEKIRINYGDLIYLPLVWFTFISLKNIKDKKRIAILIWIFVPFIIFSAASTKMQAYMLFTSPALFMVTAAFFFMLNDYKSANRLKWLFKIVLILLIAFPIRYTIERVKLFNSTYRNPEWVVELKELNERNMLNGILFNYPKPIEAMFYTNLIVYPNIPEKSKISELISEGYMVIINENGNVPDDIKALEGVLLKNFTEF